MLYNEITNMSGLHPLEVEEGWIICIYIGRVILANMPILS